MVTKVAYYSQVHACIHQPERIAGGDDTVERWQVLEPTTNNLHFRMRAELPTEDIAELLASIYENQPHSHSCGESQNVQAQRERVLPSGHRRPPIAIVITASGSRTLRWESRF